MTAVLIVIAILLVIFLAFSAFRIGRSHPKPDGPSASELARATGRVIAELRGPDGEPAGRMEVEPAYRPGDHLTIGTETFTITRVIR